MFCWKCYSNQSKATLVTLFFFVSSYVVAQELGGSAKLPNYTPNKKTLGLLNADDPTDEFSFLTKKTESEPNLFEKEKFLDASLPYLKNLKKTVVPNLSENSSAVNTGDITLEVVKTTADKMVIVARDFGEQDGDRVMIRVNDIILIPTLYLKNSFYVFEVKLIEGENKFDFTALNQGAIGLNTADLRFIEENADVPIVTEKWYLSTLSTATVIVIKKPKLE